MNGQALNDDQRRLLDEIYQRLTVWQDGCREIHDRAREARAILLLQDPRQDPPNTPPDKRTIQLQTLKSTFNGCAADQMDNIPEAFLLPEREELAPMAEDLTDVVRYVMSVNDYESLHRQRVEDFFCTGTAVTQIAWDESLENGRGNVALLRWPIESFLWDPAAARLQDARALFKISWYPLSWYASHYPGQAAYIQADCGVMEGIGVPDARKHSGGDEARAMLIEYWYRGYDANTKRYRISVAYAAGRALLGVYEDVYAHGLYPFVLDVHTAIEGMPVGDGLIQECAPMMRYINRYARYIDTNLRMSSKGRMLVDRAAGIDGAALADWDTDIIHGDRIDTGALKWLQHAPLSGMASGQMLQFQSDLKQDSGQNQFTRGETVGGVTAASAITALQESGGKIARLRTNALNQGYKLMVEQVLWLLSQFYDESRVLYITGSRPGEAGRRISAGARRLFDGESGTPPPGWSDGTRGTGAIPPPPYMVQVQVQRRNPLRVQALNDLYLQAYSMAAQAGQPFALSTLFELMQVDGKERIVPILKASEQTYAYLAQLKRENEELQAALGQLADANEDLLRRKHEAQAETAAAMDAARETVTEMALTAPRREPPPTAVSI